MILLFIIGYGLYKGYPHNTGGNNDEVKNITGTLPGYETSAPTETTTENKLEDKPLPNDTATYQLELSVVDENGRQIAADAYGSQRFVTANDYAFSGHTWHLKVLNGITDPVGDAILTSSNDAAIVTKTNNGLWRVMFFNDGEDGNKNVILTVKAGASTARYQIAVKPQPTEDAGDGNGPVDGTVMPPP